MRIDKLTLKDFKNLHNFSVNFDEESLTTVIVGQNGTGKSNLLEALIIIFRDLDLGETTDFGYQLDYLCRGRKIHLNGMKAGERPEILVDGEEVSYPHFTKQDKDKYLPSYVFGYYSGPSNRMEAHFATHQQRFYKALLDGVDKPLRRLLYARLVHSQFVLLSFFSEGDEAILNFLKEHLHIVGLESVLFVMRKPPWNSPSGDERFWRARGVVQDFLDVLYGLALAPLRIEQPVSLNFRKSSRLEHLYLYLKDNDAVIKLADHYKRHDSAANSQNPDDPNAPAATSQQEFFKALESTYISELISEVRIRVKIKDMASGALTYRDLSEGEQQLLMVLGLLRFTKEDEALFLLDEPDTHLNPAWGIQYIDFLKKVVGDHETSHVIMTTHDPLVIAGLKRPQVQIMRRDPATKQITAEAPLQDPKGMGVAAILTSDLFGLRSTLDPETQGLLDERRELVAADTLSPKQRERLSVLNQQLEGLDFTITVRDPLYQNFVRAMTKLDGGATKGRVSLTPEQQQQQREQSLQILRDLRAKEEIHP